ncbi:MAG: peptidoglycan D,D-transpeptidase FtsI family protein [Clostridium sp.]
MQDIKKNVTRVMIVFLFLFIALISYIAYFQVFKAYNIANMPGNPRIWAERNAVLRGTIYDSDMNALTKSIRTGPLSQKIEYPYGALYANPVGYMSKRYGVEGLEATYDKQLSTYNSTRTNIKTLFTNFSFKNLKDMFFARNDKSDQVGNSVVTTLNTKVQEAAMKALGGRKGAAVAIDPKTGQVLAMVSSPSYNPNDLEQNMAELSKDPDAPMFNRAIYGKYPPGSTFKVVTTTAALNNIPGVTSEIFHDTGKIKFPDGQILHNNDDEVNGNINLRRAFVVSSNVVYGTVAMDLGNDALRETAEMFGFNEQIPAIGFTMSKSQFPKYQSWQVGDIAQSGIGQSGVLATPMQMALVASTVANDGVMMEPKLVDKIINQQGKTVQSFPNQQYRRVMSQSDAATIKSFMTSLVENNMSGGYWPFFAGYDVAAKTGTATYTTGKPDSWLEGFAPANNPQIAFAVIVQHAGYGADAASNVAGAMLHAFFNNTPPQ